MNSISFSLPSTTQLGTLEVLRRIGIASVTFNFLPNTTAPTELLSAAEKASGTGELPKEACYYEEGLGPMEIEEEE